MSPVDMRLCRQTTCLARPDRSAGRGHQQRRAGARFPPRGTVRFVRKALAAGVLLACLWVASACRTPHNERSALCDALGAPVHGIDEITWDNGLTRQRATWGTLLDSGILASDAATRRSAAEAVRTDTEGFDEVLKAAPDSLRPHLERLRLILLEPDVVETRRDDPVIVESVRAVRDASRPDMCDWVR